MEWGVGLGIVAVSNILIHFPGLQPQLVSACSRAGSAEFHSVCVCVCVCACVCVSST